MRNEERSGVLDRRMHTCDMHDTMEDLGDGRLMRASRLRFQRACCVESGCFCHTLYLGD